MTIPNISFAIQDGALGAVPANNSRTAVKMGICSGAIASVAASKLIGSTTSLSGVTFTARSAGAGGNQISVTYASPSGGTTTVTVSGNAISVAPKTGAVNSDIVTAIQANATANALVTVAATTPSDVVIAVAQTYLTGGITGNINTVIPETSPSQAVTDLGYGPLTEAAVHSLSVTGGTVLCMPLNPSSAGSNTAVSHVGSGGGTVAVAGTPNDAYSVVVNIVLGGALGTAQFKYSLDGGATYSATFVVPSGGTYVIPHTGLTLTFASTFVAGDTYNFTCTASAYTLTDVQNGVAALLASGRAFGFVHLVGESSSVAGSASLAAGLETLLLAAASTNFVFAHGITEVANDTDANIISAFASTVCTRVMPCAGRETVTSTIPGSGSLTRNGGFSVAARESAVAEQNDLGRVADGALPGVTAITRNEALSPGLDAVGFTTLRTFQGLAGAYITTGHMLVNPGSDYFLSQNRRVMDLACTVAYQAVLPYLNDTLRVNTSGGTIADSQAATIENHVGGALAAAVVSPGHAVAASVVVDRSNNVLATKQLNVTVRILPFGYSKMIALNIGFTPNI